MNTNIHPDAENLLARIEHLEENRRLIQNALELALSLGDFQKDIKVGYEPEHILKEAEKRLRYVLPVKAYAFYLVDQEGSDFIMKICEPSAKEPLIKDEVEYMIDKGFFAWAIRERRGVMIFSRNHAKQFILHVIATHSRIRGMYVGLLPDHKNAIPDRSLTLLSIILQNTANALESIEFYRLLRNQNLILEKKVEERTKALARSEKQLQQVMKLQAIGTLAGGIAHDFNNILFPILGYTELTMDDLPTGSQAQKNLEEILKAANRAKKLVQQILAFSRQGSQERKPLKIQFLLQESLKLLRATLPASIEIECNINDECGPIMGDPTQIHQVIMNLCTNAYHAMQDTGGKLEVSLKEIDISYDQSNERVGMKPGRHLELLVKDTGHGMEMQVLDRIFEPYYTTKKQGQGAGLGLSIAHGIIKNHGGDIRVKSQPGEGSTFSVHIPIIDDVEFAAEPEDSVTTNQSKAHILLIDDEKQIIDIEHQILERLGYQVTAKTDSQKALAAFAAMPDKYDLVITDMTMPKMTGIQLAHEMMAIKPDLPVILCTGFNETITEEKALAMGIDKFVMKPIVRDDLANTIQTVLSSPKASQNKYPSGKR